MATLLTVCQDALKETGNFDVPTTIVGNGNPTAVQLLALANRTGKTLARDYFWQKLLTEYSFVTVASTDTYALPSDFGSFANLTQWDETNDYQVEGPVSPARWQYLQSSGLGASSVFQKAFRVAGNLFYIYPVPSAVETIAYQYYSTYFVSGKAAFTLDADVPLLDDDLFVLGIKWRWLKAKGDSWEDEFREYRERRDALLASDGGKDVVRFGRRMASPYGGLPETGFGL